MIRSPLHPVSTLNDEDLPVLAQWFVGGGTGISSKYMAAVALAGRLLIPVWGDDTPSDADDLGRCILLIETVPNVRRAFPALRTRSLVWAAFLDHWEELTNYYITAGDSATTRRMNELRESAEKMVGVVPPVAPFGYPMKLVDPTPIAPVDHHKPAIEKVQDWLVPHMEHWHGPRASWSDETKERFHEKFGFLVLFATDFRFPKIEWEEVSQITKEPLANLEGPIDAKGVCESMTCKQMKG